MPSDYDNDLLHEGILRYKAKEFDTARNYLERALENADDLQTQAEANFYLSKLTDDPVQKRKFLEETLAIDMSHAEARRDLAILDGKLKPQEIVNPDTPPDQAAGTESVKVDRFTCPKCGGRMVYSPDGSTLVCEYCNRNQTLSPEVGSKEEDFFLAMANGLGQRKPVSMVTFQCQGCGACFVLAPEEISATCAYCGSVHVIATQERHELIEPDAIFPMTIDQKQSVSRLVEFVEKKRLRPRGKVQVPHGLYLPVWCFDITGSILWNGQELRNKVVVPVSGEKPVQFNNICIPGSSKQANLLKWLLPEYDFHSVSVYDPRFLAGWPAEIYDVSMADASLDARQIAVERIRSMVQDEYHHLANLQYSTSTIMVSAFKFVLVPAWLTEIPLVDSTYRVVINGQTGSVHSGFPAHGLAGWLDTLLGS